jgi:Domain of unknown function (DUF4224)
MSLFLSTTELQELTGYKLASKQTRWFKCHGYYVESNASGIPRITYAQIEDMRRNNTPANAHSLNTSPSNKNHSNQNSSVSTKTEPDLNGLRQKIYKVSING